MIDLPGSSFPLRLKDKNGETSACLHWVLETQLDGVSPSEILHREELAYYDSNLADRRRRSFLAGRCAAKAALKALGGTQPPHEIEIRNGAFNHPFFASSPRSGHEISMSHCDGQAVALAYDSSQILGIDLERLGIEKNAAVFEREASEFEHELVREVPLPPAIVFLSLWTLKEAISKALRVGMTAPFHLFETASLAVEDGAIHSTFLHFPNFKGLTLMADRSVVSIVLPKFTEIVGYRLKLPQKASDIS